MPTILVCQTLVTIVSSLVFWFIFKGHKVKQPLNPIERGTLEKFNAKQIISLLSILLMLVLLIFVKVNIGVAAFAVAACCSCSALPTTARRSSPCPGAPS